MPSKLVDWVEETVLDNSTPFIFLAVVSGVLYFPYAPSVAEVFHRKLEINEVELQRAMNPKPHTIAAKVRPTLDPQVDTAIMEAGKSSSERVLPAPPLIKAFYIPSAVDNVREALRQSPEGRRLIAMGTVAPRVLGKAKPARIWLGIPLRNPWSDDTPLTDYWRTLFPLLSPRAASDLAAICNDPRAARWLHNYRDRVPAHFDQAGIEICRPRSATKANRFSRPFVSVWQRLFNLPKVLNLEPIGLVCLFMSVQQLQENGVGHIKIFHAAFFGMAATALQAFHRTEVYKAANGEWTDLTELDNDGGGEPGVAVVGATDGVGAVTENAWAATKPAATKPAATELGAVEVLYEDTGSWDGAEYLESDQIISFVEHALATVLPAAQRVGRVNPRATGGEVDDWGLPAETPAPKPRLSVRLAFLAFLEYIGFPSFLGVPVSVQASNV